MAPIDRPIDSRINYGLSNGAIFTVTLNDSEPRFQGHAIISETVRDTDIFTMKC